MQNVYDLVQAGAALVRAGDHTSARTMLQQAIDRDPANEQAWLWMSGAVESPAEQRAMLCRVLRLNPNNRAAQRGIAYLDQQYPQLAPPPSGPATPLPWSPPEPLAADQLAQMAATCHGCGAQVYGTAAFCWRCHATVHCCANCVFVAVAECKQRQGITSETRRNDCPWWRPA